MTKWSVAIGDGARKDLRKIGKANRVRVLEFLRDRISHLENPRQLGGPLKGELSGFWRYRVGDMRLLCRIDDGELVVLVVSVGNRREIYR